MSVSCERREQQDICREAETVLREMKCGTQDGENETMTVFREQTEKSATMNSLRYTGGTLQLLDDGKVKASWPANCVRSGAADDRSDESLQSGEYSLKSADNKVLKFEWIGHSSTETGALQIVEIVSALPEPAGAHQQYLKTSQEGIEAISRIAGSHLSLQVVYFDERFFKSTIFRMR
jgi:hypothetical protein